MLVSSSYELLVFLVVCLFTSGLSLAVKVYGYRIMFGLIAGILWVLLALNMSNGFVAVACALFGGVFMLVSATTASSFLRGG